MPPAAYLIINGAVNRVEYYGARVDLIDALEEAGAEVSEADDDDLAIIRDMVTEES